jgi:endonuclease YncB( thermonuclease family)
MCVFSASAWTVVGEVIRVSDGDTVTLLDREQRPHKIRLAGIDAPERGQAWGKAAGRALRLALLRRTASADCDTVDRYGREVCRLKLDQQDVCLAMLNAGLAWHYVAYIRDQPRDEAQRYAAAERDARQARRGLWAERDPTPPWEWRRARTEKATPRVDRQGTRKRLQANGERGRSAAPTMHRRRPEAQSDPEAPP